MGFLSKFHNIWKDPFTWKPVEEAWHNFAGQGTALAKSWASGQWNTVAGLVTGDSKQLASGLRSYTESAKNAAAAGAAGIGVPFAIPVIKQAAESAMFIQNEAVKRPIGATALVLGDNSDLPDFRATSMDAWKRAYNDTERVSAGQALLWSMDQDPFTGRSIYHIPDPRTPEGQAFFHTDQPGTAHDGRLFSGAMDFALDVWPDPFAAGLKTGKLAKLKYVSKPMNSTAIARGADDAYLNSKKADEVFSYIRDEAKTQDEAHLRLFNKMPGSGTVNGVLWDAAHLDDAGRARDVFNAALGSMWGDDAANDILVRAVPEMARSLLARKQAGRMGAVARAVDEGDPAVKAILDARRETDATSMMDAAAQGRGIYGQAYGALINQNVPRMSYTSKWRAGMHQIFNGDPPIFLAKAASVLQQGRAVLPSSTWTNVVDFNDANMSHLLRSNWESAKALAPERVADLTTQYARASTPESRFRIFNDAENEIFAALADKHGFTRDEVSQVLPLVNRLRGGNRASFTNSRRFLSKDTNQFAKQLLADGDEQGAHRAAQFADEIDAAVARGDQPSSVIVHYDMDGNPIVMPENFNPADHPLMPSQTADDAAAMNWNVLNQALWWNRKGPAETLRANTYKVYDRVANLADTVNQYWKVGVMLRAATAWRASSDEILRMFSDLGSGFAIRAGVDGLVNAPRNMYAGGRLLVDKVNIARTRRGLNTHNVATAKVESQAPAVAPMGRPVKFDGQDVQSYETYEAALADGMLSTADYVKAVHFHADNTPGALHDDLARMVQAHREGVLTDAEFHREVIEHALHQNGRDTYAKPAWQQATLDQTVQNHFDRAIGEDGRPLVVDPFTGLSPEAQTSDAYRLLRTQTLHEGQEREHLDRWLHGNVDELLKPGTVVHLMVARSGKIRVAVAKALDNQAAVKAGGGVRLAGGVVDKLTPDAAGLTIHTAHGPKRVDAAFEGASGARFRVQVSASGTARSWINRVQDRKHAELSQKTQAGYKEVSPTDPNYPTSYERGVNIQLGNDPVARQFMQGRTVDDVLQWMFHTQEGRAYYERLGAWQAHSVVQVHSVQKMVEKYLPDDGSVAARALRSKALDRSVTHNDLVKVVPDADMRPTIHGSALDMAVGKTTKDIIDNAIGKIFNVLQDKPADYLARFPFAKEKYSRHVDEILKSISQQYASKGEMLPAKMITRAQDIAKERTLADVRKYMYDATTTHDLARMARLVVPFGNAAMDSYQKWGTIFREKPWTAYNLWKAWTAPERSGHVQDENGNVKENIDGVDRWYSVNPKTMAKTLLPADYRPKTEYVLFQPPSWLTLNSMPGAKPTWAVNKESFNTFLSLPTAGPLVGIPASHFAMSHPEFAENRFVKTFVLPIGVTSPTDQFLPGSVKTLLQMFNPQDGDIAAQQAQAIYQTEMVRHALGQRTTVPTYVEAREKASHLRGVRFMSQFMGLTPQFRTPYAPYVDAYRQMKGQAEAKRLLDPSYDVDTDFYDQFGEEFFYLTGSVTRNRLGVPSTIAGQRAYQKYQDMIDAHPDIASLIIGSEGAGAFSQAVYQNQLRASVGPGSSDKMRYRMSLSQTVEDTAQRLGWVKFGKLMDAVDADLAERGLSDINQKGAEDLKDARNKFIQNNMWWDQSPAGGRQVSPWYVDYSTRDSSRMTARLNSLSQIVTDPRLSQRDDIQGLAQYLNSRQQVTDIMVADGFKTLNSKKATALREQWQAHVQELKGNLSFASLYNRWLIGDQYLDAPFTPAAK